MSSNTYEQGRGIGLLTLAVSIGIRPDSQTGELTMKRLYVAAWSVAGWACVFGLKNWYLALGAFAVAVLIEVSPKR